MELSAGPDLLFSRTVALMRGLCVINICFLAACGARAQQPAVIQFAWEPPFESIAADGGKHELALLLITNEDPFLEAAENVNPPAWCANSLTRSCQDLIEARPDLRHRMRFQSMSAGLPDRLRGGRAMATVPRAVLALCDGNYRLLGLMVGIPNTDELLDLIEDGEDVAAMKQMLSEKPDQVLRQLLRRSGERVSRLWRGALEETAAAMDGDNGGDPSPRSRMRRLSEMLEPIYLADVRLRFKLSDATDQTRLMILEQHPQTRRPWCQAVVPFLAGCDFYATWRWLVESLWGHQPVTADAQADQLLAWFDSQINTDAVVLSLTPPMHLQRQPWPPVVARGSRRGLGWQEVHQRAQQHPYRVVDTQQLAVLMRARGLTAVDIRYPALARYLLLRPGENTPLVFRENASPGRLAGVLKRFKPSVVQP